MRSIASFCAAGAIGALGLIFVVEKAAGQRQEQATATAALPPAPLPQVLRDYPPVTADRLRNPQDGDWLMIRRTYDGWGYSPLDQINPQNVAKLHPLWVFSTGEAKVHESAPVVHNGVMFVTTPNNQVIAIDVRTGN